MISVAMNKRLKDVVISSQQVICQDIKTIVPTHPEGVSTEGIKKCQRSRHWTLRPEREPPSYRPFRAFHGPCQTMGSEQRG